MSRAEGYRARAAVMSAVVVTGAGHVHPGASAHGDITAPTPRKTKPTGSKNGGRVPLLP